MQCGTIDILDIPIRELRGKRELKIANDVTLTNDIEIQDDDQSTSSGLDPARLPQNTVAINGQWVKLECASSGSGNHRVQWQMYAQHTKPDQSLISENEFLFEHTEKARYSIIHGDPNEYSLRISSVKMTDAGVYICEDVNANPINKKTHGIQLTVVGKYFLRLYYGLQHILHFILHDICFFIYSFRDKAHVK